MEEKVVIRLRRPDLKNLLNRNETILVTNNADLGVSAHLSDKGDKIVITLDATWIGEVMQIEVPKELIEFEELGD